MRWRCSVVLEKNVLVILELGHRVSLNLNWLINLKNQNTLLRLRENFFVIYWFKVEQRLTWFMAKSKL